MAENDATAELRVEPEGKVETNAKKVPCFWRDLPSFELRKACI